jgi:hypothetical protein
MVKTELLNALKEEGSKPVLHKVRRSDGAGPQHGLALLWAPDAPLGC